MDFLVHLPAMDPRRNEEVYRGSNEIVDRFLGDDLWRAEWERVKSTGRPFDLFVAEQFANRMVSMEYLLSGIPEAVMIRSSQKNLRLYRLAFFTKHPLAAKFWKSVKACIDDQHMLF